MKPKNISRVCIKLSGNFSDFFIIHGNFFSAILLVIFSNKTVYYILKFDI